MENTTNYYDQIHDDVLQALRDNYTADDFSGMDRDEIAEMLFDDLYNDDAVTGNGSGSYFFSWCKSREMVLDNYDYVPELADAVIDRETLADWLINADWESVDVSIRCYLLPSVIDDVLDGVDFDADDAAEELIKSADWQIA